MSTELEINLNVTKPKNKKRKINHSITKSSKIEFRIEENILNNDKNEGIIEESEKSNKRKSIISPIKDYTKEHLNNLFSNINWKTDKNKKEINSIIIFDWDDTLMCTYILSNYGYFSDINSFPKNILIQISILEIRVIEILEKSLEKGDTYIITNSDLNWVNYSCKQYFPNVYPMLKKIKIISSRDYYEYIHPYCSLMWKRETFHNVMKNYNLNLPTNIICIGDNFGEIEAGRNLEKCFYYGFIKTIKLKNNPTVEQMLIQLELIIEKFDYLISVCKNWTINIEKKITKNNQ